MSQLVEIKQTLNQSGKGTIQLFEEARGLELKLKELIEVDFVNLQKKLEEADLPWTSGRPILELKK